MNARITVIDDDADTLEVMREILEGDGHMVTCATGVSPDLSEIVSASPDVLIVDLLLSSDQSGLSGWDVVRLVKAHRLLHNLQVLVVSADYPTLRSHIPEAADMDGVRLLTKPFTLDSLIVLVRDALRSREPEGIRPAIQERPHSPAAPGRGPRTMSEGAT
jgi:DNA-binding response OmpR family regulator